MKKLLLAYAMFVSSTSVFAGPGDVGSVISENSDSGLECVMSYSSSDALSTKVNSTSRWLSDGEQMVSSAVGVNKNGLSTAKPANYILVKKERASWSVTLLDEAKKPVGSFSFLQNSGMKATVKAKALMAKESEDPAKYDKLEVSCQHVIFAG